MDGEKIACNSWHFCVVTIKWEQKMNVKLSVEWLNAGNYPLECSSSPSFVVAHSGPCWDLSHFNAMELIIVKIPQTFEFFNFTFQLELSSSFAVKWKKLEILWFKSSPTPPPSSSKHPEAIGCIPNKKRRRQSFEWEMSEKFVVVALLCYGEGDKFCEELFFVLRPISLPLRHHFV